MEYPFQEKVIVLTETLEIFKKESLPVLIDVFSYFIFLFQSTVISRP